MVCCCTRIQFLFAGLVVAVLDHEHFKLLLVYKSKKYLRKQIDEMQEDIHVVRVRNCIFMLSQIFFWDFGVFIFTLYNFFKLGITLRDLFNFKINTSIVSIHS